MRFKILDHHVVDERSVNCDGAEPADPGGPSEVTLKVILSHIHCANQLDRAVNYSHYRSGAKQFLRKIRNREGSLCWLVICDCQEDQSQVRERGQAADHKTEFTPQHTERIIVYPI